MALSDDQRTLITAMIGDCDVNGVPTNSTDGVIALNIELVEAEYEGRPITLQKLYTHRDCIDLVLARLKDQVNTQVGNIQASNSQRARTLLQMRSAIVARIVAVEKRIRATGANILPIETVKPVADEDQRTFITAIR